MIAEGLTHTSRLTVTEHDTAIALGSGDMPVLATPRMTALMENAAMLAVAGELGEGSTTVGGHLDVSHVRPTPVGADVEATAVLEKTEGRKLSFRVVATQNGEVIGEGTHLRFIVDRERFLSRVYQQ